MAVDKMLRLEDYSVDDLIDLVRDSMKEYITPGKKISGLKIFYIDDKYARPKHDVIFYWRALYVKSADEYEFAMRAFGDWSTYRRFTRNSKLYVTKFQPMWEEEREMYVRSKAMRNIVNSIREGNIVDSKWLETHITKMAEPKDKKKSKDKLDKVISMSNDDDIMNTIENAYRNLN